MCILGEVVFVDEFLGDVAEFDADVFRAVERGAEVKVGDVVARETGVRGGTDAVEL